MAKFELIDRETLPSMALGIDWSAKRRLIAVRQDAAGVRDRYLFVVPSRRCSAGIRGLGQTPHRASLYVQRATYGDGVRQLAEGRVSMTLLYGLRERIETWFECPGMIAQIDLLKTLVITP